jgi:uncharacterized cupin superfamily protein
VSAPAGLRRGRLHDPAAGPAVGEVTDPVAILGGLGGSGDVVVEEIRSGVLAAPVDYLQDVDEWVVVLRGTATLVVDGEMLELVPGDWVLLPAGTPHTLARTEHGTHWLTVTANRAH